MARIVAIEWDSQELRLAAGSRHGSTVSIDCLLAAPLGGDNVASTPDILDAQVAAALSKLVQQAGLSRSEVVIAAGRANVELRALTLPNASDDELPDMVRFAAQRSFAQIGDAWPLDFIKLSSDSETGLQVLASAMNPALISKLKKIAEQATLEPKKILLRPLASASLAMVAQSSLRTSSALIVSVVGDEADLLVSQNGAVSLIRTSRLPSGDAAVREKAIVAEIKRTWMAAESQVPAVSPTQLVIWGELGGVIDLGKSLTEKTGLPTTVLSLTSTVEIKSQLPPTDIERFVPVVGMIHQSNHLDPNSMDFLSPRKRVEKKRPVLQMAIGGVLASLLLLFGLYSYFSKHSQLDSEIALLKKELKDQEKLVKASELKTLNWKKVANFLQSDVNWLDQLVYLSEKSLPADSMVVTMVPPPVFQVNPQTGTASIGIQVAATEPEMLTGLEEDLRVEGYKISGSNSGRNRDTKSPYTEVGKITIDLEKVDLKTLVANLKKPSRPIPEETHESPDAKGESTPSQNGEAAEEKEEATDGKKGATL